MENGVSLFLHWEMGFEAPPGLGFCHRKTASGNEMF